MTPLPQDAEHWLHGSQLLHPLQVPESQTSSSEESPGQLSRYLLQNQIRLLKYPHFSIFYLAEDPHFLILSLTPFPHEAEQLDQSPQGLHVGQDLSLHSLSSLSSPGHSPTPEHALTLV